MRLFKQLVVIASTFVLLSCEGSNTDGINDTTYSTTSSKGDYAEWSIVDDLLTLNWQVIDDAGDVDHILDITALCAPAASSGLQSCSMNTVNCTDLSGSCPAPLPSGDLKVMIIPSVALFAHDDEQLHVGFARDNDACSANIDGDYSYLHLGHGKRDIFGLYRSDADFLNVTHIDYGVTSDDPAPLLETSAQRIAYTTGSPVEALTDNGCANGLRQRSNGSIDLRLMATESGLFVLDLPAGEGGLLAFKAENAASLADFENTSFGGLDFDGDSGTGVITTTAFSIDFDTILIDEINFTAVHDGSGQSLTLMPLTGADINSTPAYPNFNVIANDGAGVGSATSNPLQSDYNTPNDLPGLFKIDNTSGTGRHIVGAVTFNDKVIAFGSTYKYKDAFDTNPSTGLPYDPDYYIVGNWLMFEK